MNQRIEYWTWLSGFLTGGIAGVGAALLLAPRPGRETRGRVGRKLLRAARQLRHRELVDRESALAGNGGRAAPSDAAPSSE